jgi:hypothetical protein
MTSRSRRLKTHPFLGIRVCTQLRPLFLTVCLVRYCAPKIYWLVLVVAEEGLLIRMYGGYSVDNNEEARACFRFRRRPGFGPLFTVTERRQRARKESTRRSGDGARLSLSPLVYTQKLRCTACAYTDKKKARWGESRSQSGVTSFRLFSSLISEKSRRAHDIPFAPVAVLFCV